jgi:hypothetical protein
MLTATRVFALLTIVGFSPPAIHVAQAENVAREFFKAAPATLFYTEDEMSEEDKAALIKAGFTRAKSFDCSAWGVAEETSSTLVLQYCADSSVTVRSYRVPARPDESVIVLQSSRSSGHANDLSVFRFKKGQQAFVALLQEELSKLGIDRLTENDFLEPEQRFALDEARTVGLELSEKGELLGRLITWMDPRWEHRKEAFSVKFVWSEGRFKRVREKVG